MIDASIDTSEPSSNSHLRRPDRFDREVTTPIGDHAGRFLSIFPLGDALLISHYGKSVCSRRLLQAFGDRALDASVPILVDPARSRNWSDFGQVMVCAERNGATWYLPAEPTGVRDVCGVGDSVLAAMGIGLLAGSSLRDFCRYALVSASKQVTTLDAVTNVA